MKLVPMATALSLGLALSACGGMPTNRQLNSLNQPVVERTNYTLDLNAGAGGLSYPEQRRLSGWFEAMDLRYGDRISIDDPISSEATRANVAALAARHGLLLNETAPVTSGYVNAGNVRVIVTRAKATVPNCPNWGGANDANLGNATSPGYGCATNGNFAAMVANPDHLVKGAEGGSETVIMSSNKAIDTYREAKPSGQSGLKAQATSGS